MTDPHLGTGRHADTGPPVDNDTPLRAGTATRADLGVVPVSGSSITQPSPRSTLGNLIVVADHETVGGRLVSIVEDAVAHGARTVLLRARQTDPTTRDALVASLRAVLAEAHGLLIVAGGGGQAVHLAAAEQFPTQRPSIVGRSCHDAVEVDRAVGEGCDYVFVSPVYLTDSKPGYGPALGPAGLAALCHRAPSMPVYALGGVLPERVGECLRTGAHGIAVMGPVLRQPALVVDYLSALKEVTG